MLAVDFYWKKLGFGHPHLIGDPPTIAVFERDELALYLREAEFDVAISPSGGCDVLLRVDSLQAELDALRAQDVSIEFGPVEFVDGLRIGASFEIVDLAGYRLCYQEWTWKTSGKRPWPS